MRANRTVGIIGYSSNIEFISGPPCSLVLLCTLLYSIQQTPTNKTYLVEISKLPNPGTQHLHTPRQH